MKRFDKLRTVFWIVMFGFCVMLAGGYANIFANTELFVNLKDGKAVYEDKIITTDLFEFNLGNKTICDVENIEITPKSFSETGEQFVTFTYKDGDTFYMKKLMVSVEPVVPSFLSNEAKTLRLIKGQNVTKKQLPEIYLHYSNGEKVQVTDYSFWVDWENNKICVSYEHLQVCIAVDVIENEMDYLEVNSRLKGVPEKYIFDETDLKVTLYYTNGTNEEVTDFQIMPYKLVEGCESLVYVTYKGLTGSFKIMATKEIIEEYPLSPEEPETPKPEYTTGAAEVETPKPEYTAEPEGMENAEAKDAIVPQSTETPAVDTNDTGLLGATSAPGSVQEGNLEADKKDNTPPKTNIQNKTYTKNIKICVTDESKIASIVLRGSINKTIKNGYKLTKEGSYQLVLTDIYGNKKTVKFKLQKPVKKVEVSYSFTNKWNVIKFSAKVTGTSRAVKWSVSNKKVATVDKNGRFKAKKSGTVYLVAKLDKKKVKQEIKVDRKKKSILLY